VSAECGDGGVGDGGVVGDADVTGGAGVVAGVEGAFVGLSRPGGGGVLPPFRAGRGPGASASDRESGRLVGTSVTVASATPLPVGTTEDDGGCDAEAGPELDGRPVVDDFEALPTVDDEGGDGADAPDSIGSFSTKRRRIEPMPPWPGAGGSALVDQPCG